MLWVLVAESSSRVENDVQAWAALTLGWELVVVWWTHVWTVWSVRQDFLLILMQQLGHNVSDVRVCIIVQNEWLKCEQVRSDFVHFSVQFLQKATVILSCHTCST